MNKSYILYSKKKYKLIHKVMNGGTLLDLSYDKYKIINDISNVKTIEGDAQPPLLVKYDYYNKDDLNVEELLHNKDGFYLDIKNIKISNNPENKKASPIVEYSGGCCIFLSILIKMAIEHNKLHPNEQIYLIPNSEIPSNFYDDYKMYLTSQLEKYYGIIHKEWLDKDIFLNIPDLDDFEKLLIRRNIFRPYGPLTTEWLNTLNINHIMEQFEIIYPNFNYLMTTPRDFAVVDKIYFKLDFNYFMNKNKTTFAMVINSDKHDQGGSHWKMLYFNTKYHKLYYIDSGGNPPENEILLFIDYVVKFFINDICSKHKITLNKSIDSIVDGRHLITINDKKFTINKSILKEITKIINDNDNYLIKYLENIGDNDVVFNTHRFQKSNTECGVFASYFIYRLLEYSRKNNDPEYLENPLNKFIKESNDKIICDGYMVTFRNKFFTKYYIIENGEKR